MNFFDLAFYVHELVGYWTSNCCNNNYDGGLNNYPSSDIVRNPLDQKPEKIPQQFERAHKIDILLMTKKEKM